MENIKSEIVKVIFFAGMVIMGFTSCNEQKGSDSKAIAEEHNEAKFNNSKETDAELLVAAAEIDLEEIQLAKLAQTNTKRPNVIALGKMMELEHSKSLKELQALALKKQITIPVTLTEDGQNAYKKLVNKRGIDFDLEYCNMMVTTHKRIVDKLDKASTNATDADIRTWASTKLPVIRDHLDRSINCQKKCENSNDKKI
jgi:putative membrane protein